MHDEDGPPKVNHMIAMVSHFAREREKFYPVSSSAHSIFTITQKRAELLATPCQPNHLAMLPNSHIARLGVDEMFEGVQVSSHG